MLLKLFIFQLVAFSLVGCTLDAAPAEPGTAFTPTVLPTAANATPSQTAVPYTIRGTALAPAQFARPVTVVAVKGNLYIRRGPDLAFNPISVLMEGQKATALARDVLADWVQVRIPGKGGATGWVSIQTGFSVVSGAVDDLPESIPTDWPQPASIRNCTSHQMEADPGGIVLPAADNFPENDVRLNPSVYRIYDTQVDGSPEVMKLELKEGSAVDIKDDGDGEHKKCSA